MRQETNDFVFLSGSVVVDVASVPWLWHLRDWAYFVEDGLKWVGVCSWTAFCLVRSAADLNSLKPQEDPRTMPEGMKYPREMRDSAQKVHEPRLETAPQRSNA